MTRSLENISKVQRDAMLLFQTASRILRMSKGKKVSQPAINAGAEYQSGLSTNGERERVKTLRLQSKTMFELHQTIWLVKTVQSSMVLQCGGP